MKTYCPECGTKMEYIAKKPKFCSNCGYAFAGASKPKPKPSYQDSTETEEEEIAELPQINALEFEFEADKVQGVEFGSIIGTAAPPKEGDYPAPDPAEQVSSEKFLSDFLKEAGTSRRTDAPSQDD